MTATDLSLNTIRILVVEAQNQIQQALQVYLEQEGDLEVVGYTDNGPLALEVIEQLTPNVVILDLEMSGIDGLTTIKIIRDRFSHTKILVLSSQDERQNINQAIEAGAKGYLLKHTPLPELANAIRSINGGHFQLGPGLLEKLFINLATPLASDSNSSVEKKFIHLFKKFQRENQEQYHKLIDSKFEIISNKLNDKIELKIHSLRVKHAESNFNLQKLDQKIYWLLLGQVILLFIIGVNLFFVA